VGVVGVSGVSLDWSLPAEDAQLCRLKEEIVILGTAAPGSMGLKMDVVRLDTSLDLSRTNRLPSKSGWDTMFDAGFADSAGRSVDIDGFRQFRKNSPISFNGVLGVSGFSLVNPNAKLFKVGVSSLSRSRARAAATCCFWSLLRFRASLKSRMSATPRASLRGKLLSIDDDADILSDSLDRKDPSELRLES
jgi:hypothetical protein